MSKHFFKKLNLILLADPVPQSTDRGALYSLIVLPSIINCIKKDPAKQ